MQVFGDSHQESEDMADIDDIFIKGEPKDDSFSFNSNGLTYLQATDHSFASTHPINISSSGQPFGDPNGPLLNHQGFSYKHSAAPSGLDSNHRSIASHANYNSSLGGAMTDEELYEYFTYENASGDNAESSGDNSGPTGAGHRATSDAGFGHSLEINTRDTNSGLNRRFHPLTGQLNDNSNQKMAQSPYQATGSAFPQLNSSTANRQSQPNSFSFRRPDLQGNSSASQSNSPIAPQTPNAFTGALPMSAPVNQHPMSVPGIHTSYLQKHGLPTQSSHWNEPTPSSFGMDSPMNSPNYPVSSPLAAMNLGDMKHASMPTHGIGLQRTAQRTTSSIQASVDQKRKRRRESHNQVERRRRDNINERIQELSRLIPQHRLEDDKMRKWLSSNPPMSPTAHSLATSPPMANSPYGTSAGTAMAQRRLSSNASAIPFGFPNEEKEKGPNKGDILNGSVAWTQDLMWCLQQKFNEQDRLKESYAQRGEPWPFPTSDEEARMRTELEDALRKGETGELRYSRADGSGLRVPKHTNHEGHPLANGANSMALNADSTNPGIPGFKIERSPSEWPMDHPDFNTMRFSEEAEYGRMEI